MEALIVAFSAAAAGLLFNLIQRGVEARQRKLLCLIDEIGREVVLTERMIYKTRMLAIETIESGKMPTRLETERRLFDEISQNSELGNLKLKLMNEGVDPQEFVSAIHHMRQTCLTFSRSHLPYETEVPVENAFPYLRMQYVEKVLAAQKLAKALGKKLSLMHTVTGV